MNEFAIVARRTIARYNIVPRSGITLERISSVGTFLSSSIYCTYQGPYFALEVIAHISVNPWQKFCIETVWQARAKGFPVEYWPTFSKYSVLPSTRSDHIRAKNIDRPYLLENTCIAPVRHCNGAEKF